MKVPLNKIGKLLPVAALTIFLLGALSIAQEKPPQATPPKESKMDNSACMDCHSKEAESGPVVNVEALKRSPHASFSCQDCHESIKDAPHTPEMLKVKPACGNCHTDVMDAFKKSIHSSQDYEKGDHPTCVFCHGGGDTHAITAGSKWTRRQKIEVCTQCHEQTDRMKRYHVDTDAVASYNESFHGKALLRFKNEKTAICTDCHGHHDVLSPMDPAAPTHQNNVAKTCGQSDCHVGAQVNFAMSGANHFRIKVKEEPLLQGILLFFKFLIFATISFMMINVVLDLRKTVLHSEEPPQCGRPAGYMIFFSFLSLVIAIAMATLHSPYARHFGFAALGFLILAFGAYLVRPQSLRHNGDGPIYPRMSLALRIQHLFLTLSILCLMFTGLPLRFIDSPFARSGIDVIGGLANARLVHRTAAVILIATWMWHFLYLIYRWWKNGWSFKSWTMLPTAKDGRDFFQTMKYYLGMSKEEPKFDRYTFRSKVDYLAEYWGLPVMVLSGFVLWFPMYFSNRLSESAWGIAIIAHGYEATLALLAIVCWHLYNVHLSPNVFPMSKIWYKGTLTHAEMEREHPMELARLTKKESASGAEETGPA